MNDELAILTNDDLDFDYIYGKVNPPNFVSLDQYVPSIIPAPTHSEEYDTAITDNADPSHFSSNAVPKKVDNKNTENNKIIKVDSTHSAGKGFFFERHVCFLLRFLAHTKKHNKIISRHCELLIVLLFPS